MLYALKNNKIKILCLLILTGFILTFGFSCGDTPAAEPSPSVKSITFNDFYDEANGVFVYPDAEFFITHEKLEKDLGLKLQPYYVMYGPGDSDKARADKDLENIDKMTKLTVLTDGSLIYNLLDYECELSYVFSRGELTDAMLTCYTETPEELYNEWVSLIGEAFGREPDDVNDEFRMTSWDGEVIDGVVNYFQIHWDSNFNEFVDARRVQITVCVG